MYFGSPRVQLMIPVLEAKPKMMLTTGAITKSNYIDSKSGKVGDFHHTFGFVIVEIKDDETFLLDKLLPMINLVILVTYITEFLDGNVTRLDSIAAVILGDIHYGHHDQRVLDTTMGLLDILKPKHVILHDVFDGNSLVIMK
jgi:hypothetical protein